MNKTQKHTTKYMTLMPKEPAMRAAIAGRDVRFDGAFVYGVLTTGVYCRPSCASRRANPDNICFFRNAATAEAEGLRACKRCDPNRKDDHHAGLRQELARYIERHASEPLSLKALSDQDPGASLLMAATDRGVCFAQFGLSERALTRQLKAEFPKAAVRESSATNTAAVGTWMELFEAHIAADAPRPDVPLDFRGTAFQIRVWRFLLSVPDGDMLSYAEVASGIGSPKAIRAAAAACGANRIAVLVSCHRVLRGDGGLGGYRWG